MNWKVEAAEKLNNYYPMRQALQNIPEEIRRLEADVKAIGGVSPDKIVVRGNGGKREDRLMENLIQRQELNHRLKQAASWVKMTDKALEVLAPDEKLILYRLYIQPQKDGMQRLMEELGVEQASIYRKREKALHRFTTALYGIPDA